ncbi:MAG: preprotein translocase subunit YajC [Candidatus Omnitrophica bacterium]|nr:preprotein translocase subunit YajC [Candidatus Omnitrophota bacterium]
MQAQPNMLAFIVQLILIGGIVYFIVFRPESKRKKELQEMIKNLKKNDEVVTASGIHGVVVNVKEKTVILRLDENCRVEFDKDAILVVTKKAE